MDLWDKEGRMWKNYKENKYVSWLTDACINDCRYSFEKCSRVDRIVCCTMYRLCIRSWTDETIQCFAIKQPAYAHRFIEYAIKSALQLALAARYNNLDVLPRS